MIMPPYNNLSYNNHIITGKIIKVQGQYPVIFLTFKNQKYSRYEDAMLGMKSLAAGLYSEHRYLLSSSKLSHEDKEFFNKILSRNGNISDIAESVLNLDDYLQL